MSDIADVLAERDAALAEVKRLKKTVSRQAVRLEEVKGPHDGGWFWSQAEWSDWSNRLSGVLPDEYDGDEAQEAIIERAMTELVAEVARLTQWKSEAMEVLNGWEKVHFAMGMPGTLGQSMHEASLVEVARLTAVVQGVRRTVERIDAQRGEWRAKGRRLSARGDWPTGEAYQNCAADMQPVIADITDLLAGGTDTPKADQP